MARTALPLTNMVPNGAVLNNAGTAIDATNGMWVTIPTNLIPAGPDVDRLILYVQNTFAGTKTVTVRAGITTGGGVAYPGTAETMPWVPGFEAGKGDLVTGNLSASTGTAFIGPFEVARFINQDGSLNIDFAAGTTGLIWALMLPRVF